ncbi:MAG: hypothetical protein CR991_02725 [Proteobacteria bacterium]|nr:MAG: hypothetical protein CR991_02725 [Pseudomonadota bacterium]
MAEVKIAVQDLFKSKLSDGNSNGGHCAEAEPFALQIIDGSMEPEFAQGCIIIEGIITQRTGKRRAYHKWYDR